MFSSWIEIVGLCCTVYLLISLLAYDKVGCYVWFYAFDIFEKHQENIYGVQYSKIFNINLGLVDF